MKLFYTTDKHQYLHKESDHPNTRKRAIPYGLGLRLKRICMNNKDYIRPRNELKVQFSNRGYKVVYVNKQLNKVDKISREEVMILKKEKKNEVDRIVMALTYSRNLPNISSILRKRSLPKKADSLKLFSHYPLWWHSGGEKVWTIYWFMKNSVG